jgi:hypothetical protein
MGYGAAPTMAGLRDANLASPGNSDIPKFNSGTQLWELGGADPLSAPSAQFVSDPLIPAMLEAAVGSPLILQNTAYYFPFWLPQAGSFANLYTRVRLSVGNCAVQAAIYEVGARVANTYAITRIAGPLAQSQLSPSAAGNNTVRFALAPALVLTSKVYVIGILRTDAFAIDLGYNGPINMGHMPLATGTFECIMIAPGAGALIENGDFTPTHGTPSTSTCFPFTFMQYS